jgi:hypothetical protein
LGDQTRQGLINRLRWQVASRQLQIDSLRLAEALLERIGPSLFPDADELAHLVAQGRYGLGMKLRCSRFIHS